MNKTKNGINGMSVEDLKIMDEIIGDNLDWWSHSAISYKRKHPLIRQCIITVPLPLHNADGTNNGAFSAAFKDYYPSINIEDYHSVIINDACEKVLSDINLIEAAVTQKLQAL